MLAKVGPLKAVLFDLDDTLWACAPVIARATAALAEHVRARHPALGADGGPLSPAALAEAEREGNAVLPIAVARSPDWGFETASEIRKE